MTDEYKERDLEEDPPEEEEPANENLPIRQYLDKHIMPSLVEALDKLTEEKPEDAIQFIGEFILRQEDKMKTKWTSKAQSITLFEPRTRAVAKQLPSVSMFLSFGALAF